MNNIKHKYEFTEPKGLNNVSEFHELFGLPVLDHPQIPSPERCTLRVSLLQEELDELREAIAQNDIVGIADALSDLQYVLSGAVLEFGLGAKFSALFEEVQRSNMSKACKTLDEAELTQQHYLHNKQTNSVIEEKNGEYLVYREEDRKVLKSIYYSEVDLEKVLKA
jgi:predicted HAD superfamily Cof-like phosphohydrolase